MGNAWTLLAGARGQNLGPAPSRIGDYDEYDEGTDIASSLAPPSSGRGGSRCQPAALANSSGRLRYPPAGSGPYSNYEYCRWTVVQEPRFQAYVRTPYRPRPLPPSAHVTSVAPCKFATLFSRLHQLPYTPKVILYSIVLTLGLDFVCTRTSAVLSVDLKKALVHSIPLERY